MQLPKLPPAIVLGSKCSFRPLDWYEAWLLYNGMIDRVPIIRD